ncbi:MAG: FkbM family methyltransferase [Pseudomonadota bacterium]
MAWTAKIRRWKSLASKAQVYAAPYIPRHLKEGNRQFRLPVLSYGQPTALTTEPWLADWITWLLEQSPGPFLDVGANIGQTLLKVKARLPEQAYIGFEPNAANVFFLERLIERNGIEAATVVPVGLSTQSGLLGLARASVYDTSASLIDGFRPSKAYGAGKVFVPVLTGDAVLAELDVTAIGLIKIDVEGGEPEVLSGLEQSLQAARPPILCEVLPTQTHDDEIARFRRERKTQLEALLARLGYQIYRLCDAHARAEQIASFPDDADLSAADYLFIPQENKPLLAALTAKSEPHS